MGLQKSRSIRRIKIWRGKEKSGTRIPDDKTVKFIFLGTGMTEIMPVPLLLAHLF
jgi:hypothetical protein